METMGIRYFRNEDMTTTENSITFNTGKVIKARNGFFNITQNGFMEVVNSTGDLEIHNLSYKETLELLSYTHEKIKSLIILINK